MNRDLQAFAVIVSVCAVISLLALAGLARGDEREDPAEVWLMSQRAHERDAGESIAEREARLRELLRAVRAASPERAERAWLLMTARRESSFARYVQRDEALCRDGVGGRCDSGRALGPWQIHGMDRSATIAEQAAEALAKFRKSARYCQARGHDLWLGGTSLYATGRSCQWPEARDRLAEMRRIMARI